jgi:hypothetical protein
MFSSVAPFVRFPSALKKPVDDFTNTFLAFSSPKFSKTICFISCEITIISSFDKAATSIMNFTTLQF